MYNAFKKEMVDIKDIYKNELIYNKELEKQHDNYSDSILKNGGFEFIEIELNKYKLIDKNEKLIITQIDNKQWQDQLYKFFTSKEINERIKILGWFSGHIEKEMKEYAKNSAIINYNKEINPLFGRLNNLYKHFDKTNASNKNKDQYNQFQNLSDKSKNQQMEYDMYLIIFLIINWQNNKNGIKNHILTIKK